MQVNSTVSSASSTVLEKPRDMKQAAEAFEGMFLSLLLKTARQAAQGESSKESDGCTDTVLEMAEEQMAGQIAKGRGCRFAASMLKQLEGRTSIPKAEAPG